MLIKRYKLQLFQTITKRENKQFCTDMQDKLEEIEYSVIAATFHVNGKVNRHNVCIWDEENLHAIVELERDSPEVNMFRVISMKPLHDPLFFFREM